MGNEVNYQNPLHLAVIIEGMLAVERPQALLVLTSNPGDKSESYNALVLRVYRDANDLNSFVGYIAFRYNAVYRFKKTTALPTFSSIECRDYDFKPFPTPRKIHFDPRKAELESPQEWLQASFEASQNTVASVANADPYMDFFSNKLGELLLKKAKPMILDFIDGK